MKKGHLSDYFEGAAAKVLSAVDVASLGKSNQHEIGTTTEMRKFLGTSRERFTVNFVWLGGEQESVSEVGSATHYNSREGKPRAPEYRFYYPTNSVTEMMSEGDVLLMAMRSDRSIFFIVVPDESELKNSILWLFGIDQIPSTGFVVRQYDDENDPTLDFAARFILDEIGIEFEDPNANSLDAIIERFGLTFPSTAEFSQLARLTLPEVNALEGADIALMAWLDHEEALFRRLEKKVLADRIRDGFFDNGEPDVDAFIKFSLGVQNRRKSRMGHSFENHLKAVFDAFELRYDAQVITEKGKKPDFIFPGKREYFDPTFDVDRLTVLAAKSTCKDRWPQILPEAERIPKKHLVTIEVGISEAQTEQMLASNVQLIVPEPLHTSYTSKQHAQIWTMHRFVEHVQTRQSAGVV